MKSEIERFNPNRVAVDSLSALERVATPKGFREFVIGLTSSIKHRETAGLFTSTTPTLMGGTSVTEAHISTVTDSIIMLRYVEMYGEMRRGLTVLKCAAPCTTRKSGSSPSTARVCTSANLSATLPASWSAKLSELADCSTTSRIYKATKQAQ
jgi:hypothetical protein